MVQSLISLSNSDRELNLKNALISKNAVQKDVLEQLIKERDHAVDNAKKQIQGICYSVDYQNKCLKVFDTYTGKEIAKEKLPGNPRKFSAEEWDNWGTSAVVIDDVEFQKEGDINYSEEGLFGLVIKNELTYFYSEDLYKKNILAKTDYFIFGGIPKVKNASLPYDMYLSPKRDTIFLTNRDEGKIYLFDLKSNKFTKEFSVRGSGSNKAINLAIASDGKVYITDNASPILNILETASGNISKKNLGFGILGNLVLSPDENSIYLLSIKPELNFRNLSLKDFKELKNFPMKGEAFSNGDDPTDLISITPDKKNILVMTYLNEPNPYTPVLTVVDLEKNKAVKRFSIKDETKPINIAFKEFNPVGSVNRDIEEILLENGLISVNKLREIKISLANEENENIEKTDEKEQIVEELEIQTQSLEFERRKDEEKQANPAGELVPKKVKHIILPQSACKHIIEVLIGNFWGKTEIDLSEIPEAMTKLGEIAENVRRKLEYYDIDIVKVKNFHEKIDLDGVIQREYILEMIDEEESRGRTELKTAPANCPNCTAPMYGAWECMACGFTIEKPEDALRRKNASADPLANLQRGSFFVIDKDKGILMEVDKFHTPVWMVSAEVLGLKSITGALRLYNRNTLILDTEGNKIIEITPKGRVEWEYKPVNPRKSGLSKPTKVTVLDNSNLLIADTLNHRVMETDLEGNIIWEYGKSGQAGIESGFLSKPTDIQKTYDDTYLITDSGNNRIIELVRDLNQETKNYSFQKKWQYGNKENSFNASAGKGINQLKNPIAAFKDLNGKYLIFDYGNLRTIEVNEEKEITWEYKIKQNEEQISINEPEQSFRLKNKDLLVVGDGKAVQIMTDNKSITWTSTLEELAAKTTFRVTEESVKSTKLNRKKQGAYIGRVGDKKEEIKEEENKPELNRVKKVNASHYMRKVGEKEEELPTEPKNQEQNEKDQQIKNLIEEKKKKLSEEKNTDKLKVMASTEKELVKFPVLITDKNEGLIKIANREGDILWSYQEKGSKINYAEITDRKSLIIADSTEVIEVELKTKKIIWKHPCNAKSAIKLKNGNILVCNFKNYRTEELSPNKEIIWSFSESDISDAPIFSVKLSSGNYLIVNNHSHLVKEVNQSQEIVWSFGQYREMGKDGKHLYGPEYASRLSNGNTLIADTRNGRVIEVSEDGAIVWSFGDKENQRISAPSFAKRISNGNTLIYHTGGTQIIEVDPDGKTVWRMFFTN